MDEMLVRVTEQITLQINGQIRFRTGEQITLHMNGQISRQMSDRIRLQMIACGAADEQRMGVRDKKMQKIFTKSHKGGRCRCQYERTTNPKFSMDLKTPWLRSELAGIG